MKREKRILFGKECSVDTKCPSGSFASYLNRLRGGVERLELSVILCAAPLREVPDVDDQEPPPLRPGQVALPE